MAKTFTVGYINNDPSFGGGVNIMEDYARNDLARAFKDFRWYAHHAHWANVTWVLRRERKTIARIVGKGGAK